MTLKEAAELVGLPRSIVERLHQDGIIDNPVTDHDLKGLVIVAFIRGRVWYLKRLMARLPKRVRRKIAGESHLTRVESYILSCYMNARPGQRVSVDDVMQRVNHFLGAKVTRKQVIKIRSIAYELRRKRAEKSNG
ncbi:hypothetical protein [Geothermobacter hydrogeniphilus]|uniref:Uncharacterized protein n=1 Tax=Geothermobacter hydrogeniphilus TaxID=1969733 RepID=A0A1X0XX47_9BACT|nr:hypothetical protein [Geothermobacter hydrogeniphilus]ORJ57481.1 hypothetical protein B5V00_13610 [Geothermobacter hydrogeniphilus]